jgi:hypothetical protein
MPHGIPPLTAAITTCRCHGRTRLRLLRAVPARFGQGLGEDVREMLGAGLPPSPARSGSAVLATRSRRRLSRACYTRGQPDGACDAAVRPNGRRGLDRWDRGAGAHRTRGWTRDGRGAEGPGLSTRHTCFRGHAPPGPTLPREGLRAGRHDGSSGAATYPGLMRHAGSRTDGLMRQRATLRPHAAG